MSDAPPGLGGTRVLVVSNEQVAAQMAGPAIRARAIALQLAERGALVTLAIPGPALPGDLAEAGVECVAFGTPSARGLGDLARAADVVLTQPQRVDVAWGLRRAGTPVVYDLYVPSFVERVASLGTEPIDPALKAQLLERDRLEYAAAIELGDAFICASEQQKDHWLGALGHAGRFDVNMLERDPRGDQLVGVVPFGVPDEAPAALGPEEGAVRGKLVPADAVSVLWTGGLWNWFDPLTVLEGLVLARESDPRLHLVVMGVRHPEAKWEEHEVTRATRARAAELGMLEEGGGVVLREEWVPYAERHRYLCDAAAGVCAHRDTLETRLSFRTRFLDHLWAGLPTITTEGGELTGRMVAAGAAVSVREGDVEAWRDALLELARDDEARGRLGDAARTLGEQYRWSVVTEPLARIVAGLAEAGGVSYRARPRPGDAVRYGGLLVRVRASTKGAGSLVEAAKGALRR